MSGISSERLADTFVQVADTLVADFDLIDFLTLLTERAADLAGSSRRGTPAQLRGGAPSVH